VATEGDNYAHLFRSKGLRVEEKQGKQRTLLGGEVNYHTVTAIREGSYRITIHLEPGPLRAQVIIHARDKESADKAARQLRSLGFKVEIDEERVSATTRRPSIAALNKAIDAAEEAVKR